MAAVASAPGLPRSRYQNDATGPANTIRDPRSPHDEFPSPSGSANSSPHPDLNSEVETLSNKLISAINHQTHLDDALSQTRQDLEAAQERTRRLEAENQEHSRMVTTGALVKKAEVENQASKLLAKLSEERKRRTSVEKDKKGIEQELENLTTALFEEANEMVAAARKDRDALERKNEQLRNQLKDTETLLASNQEQLAELKTVMQNLTITPEGQDDSQNLPNGQLAPATPIQDEAGKSVESLQLRFPASQLADLPPGPPTSFTHLISPILRTDLPSYEDFRFLMEVSKKSAPSSRVNSGSYRGVTIPGLSAGAATAPSTASTASTPATQIYTPSQTPGTPATAMSGMASPMIPLKETKFYKRAVTEDIEPTLRLDTAPGLSWLARRTVVNSMSEGSLVVEPMPASEKMAVFSCALCGENRRGPEFTRTHRFRTSESENAQRYPLCTYCLNRLRSSCDYLGFLRMVKDGHWRTHGEDAEKSAWEESVRLRERMFWARIGGGVVPAFARMGSPRTSSDEGKQPKTPFSAPPALNGGAPQTKGHLRETSDAGPPVGRLSPLGRKPRSPHPPRTATEDDNDDWETAKKAPIFDDVDHSPGRKQAGDDADVVSPIRERTGRSSLNRASLRDSFRARPRSTRAASYERAGGSSGHPTPRGSPHPRRMTPSPTPPAADANANLHGENGLQISIPGGFDF